MEAITNFRGGSPAPGAISRLELPVHGRALAPRGSPASAIGGSCIVVIDSGDESTLPTGRGGPWPPRVPLELNRDLEAKRRRDPVERPKGHVLTALDPLDVLHGRVEALSEFEDGDLFGLP
jgi:hypothetical protein